ncbi:MAG: 4Fe-4S dicluster domain-containing protein [Patescibacteria group bacterium]
MELIIEEKQIQEWLADLKRSFKVFDTEKSVLPAKQFFFPPKEDIFIFDKKAGKLTSLDSSREIIIVCYHLGQLEAMTQLDEIMEKPNPDFFYWQKRKKSVLIGIIDHSFKIAPGGDLILEKINSQEYRTWVLSKKGRAIIKDKFFKKIKKPLIRNYPAEPNPLKEMLLDSELLAEAVEWSWRNNYKIWDELAEKCLGCGICTYVCPVCHCFFMEDRVSLDNSQCSRCRSWDACALPGFAQIAGGHNFHPTIKERYYNWFYHKFVRAYQEYGKAQCVACGQCARNCPAGIKISEVINEIVSDYKKSVTG